MSIYIEKTNTRSGNGQLRPNLTRPIENLNVRSMAEAVPSTIDDQVSLIDGSNITTEEKKTNGDLIFFLVSKLVPWFIYSIPDVQSGSSMILVFLAALVDLWLCRRTFSYRLVGLSWSLQQPTNGFKNLVKYHCEPDPFVPDPVESNIFWIVMTFNVIFWFVSCFLNLLKFRVLICFALLIMTALQGANFILFLQCLMLSKRQSEESFRNVMTGGPGPAQFQPQTFPDAVDIPLDKIEEKVPEEETHPEKEEEDIQEALKIIADVEEEEEEIC